MIEYHDYKINIEYLKQFFVGLLEANGTITVGLKNIPGLLQTGTMRIVIALKRNKENIDMLNLIAKHIGGAVALENKKGQKNVVWYTQSKSDLTNVFNILKIYPCLTYIKHTQLMFAFDILKNKYTYSQFINMRNKKYENKLKVLKNKSKLNKPRYFSGWLSGFVEGKGNFSLVFKAVGDKFVLRKSIFIIEQNDELHILEWIKTYFNGKTKILKDKVKKDGDSLHYRLHLYNPNSRKAIFNHFNLYPLLGYKTVSYNKFYNHHN